MKKFRESIAMILLIGLMAAELVPANVLAAEAIPKTTQEKETSEKKQEEPKKETVQENIVTYSATSGEIVYPVEGGNIYFDPASSTITKADKSISGAISIPNTIQGNVVRYIAKDAFSQCEQLGELQLPDSIESIGEGAFYACHKLTLKNGKLPQNLKTISRYAFCDCIQLKEVELPNNITTIGDSAFFAAKRMTLKQGRIPEGLINIGINVFHDCVRLNEVEWPGTYPDIPIGTFSGCLNLTLKNGTLPDSIERIGDSAFLGCRKLTFKNGKLPSGLTIIEKGAFKDCISLGEIELPDGITEIKSHEISCDEGAFEGCTNLTLKNGKLPAKLTKIDGGIFRNCTKLSDIEIHDGITSIGRYAFLGCTNLTLKNDKISSNLQLIDSKAFDSCTNLKRIILSEQLSEIREGAFNNCTSLTTVYYLGDQTAWDNILIGLYNDSFLSAKRYCSGEIELEYNTDCMNDGIIKGHYIPFNQSNYEEEVSKIFWKVEDPTIASISDYRYGVPASDKCLVPIQFRVTALKEGQTKLIADLSSLNCKDAVFDLQIGNHKYEQTKYQWKDDYSACTASRVCTRCGKEESLTMESKVKVNDPSYGEDGVTIYTVDFGVDWAEKQVKHIKNGDALCHEWNAPEYQWSEDGKTCIATRTCAKDSSYKEIAKAAVTGEITVPATCTEKGTTTYTAVFDVDWATTQIKELQDITTKEHNWSQTAYVWALDGSKCTATRRCSNDGGHKETVEAVITKQIVKPSTCTEKGTTLYVAKFDVNWAIPQINEIDNIEATGHEWNVPDYQWSEDGKSCTATRICSKDVSHKETIKARVTEEITIPATCTEKGTTTYTAEFDQDWAESQTKELQDIKEIGHEWNAPKYQWAEDGSKCTAIRICYNDSSHKEISEASVTRTMTKEPTVSEKGETTYTAEFDQDWAKEQKKVVADIPTLPAPMEGRWVYAGNGWWWYRHSDGSCTKNDWEEIDGYLYHFDANGWMQTGWQWIDGAWYYLDQSGAKLTGWQVIGGSWYYLGNDGIMLNGWQTINGNKYCFTTSGIMLTGWQWMNGNYYYFGGSGAMATGWTIVGGYWYYFRNDGTMVNGWQYIDGTWYLFASGGWMLQGWQAVGNYWYYFRNNGSMVTGWQVIGSNLYYFTSSGAMRTGWQYMDGYYYYFASSGAMKTGWQYIGSTYYYFFNSGEMATGLQTIAGYKYYFLSSGAMAIGWQYINDEWYYFADGGWALTGWQWIGGYCYYFYSDGHMARNVYIDGSYVDESGAWIA